MPGPMPQGGAPQGPPPSAGSGAPSPDQGSGGGGAISSLLQNVAGALDHLNQVISQSKATNPQEKQLIGQCNQMFSQLMDMLNGGGEPDADDQGGGAQGQTVPPEAAGNKGAIPSPQ